MVSCEFAVKQRTLSSRRKRETWPLCSILSFVVKEVKTLDEIMTSVSDPGVRGAEQALQCLQVPTQIFIEDSGALQMARVPTGHGQPSAMWATFR